MSNRDRMELEGEVIDVSKDKFKVRTDNDALILCTLSGKIRINAVKILPGDRVTCEVSEYDMTKGRIVYRNK